MTASREAKALLDRLTKIAGLIESHQVVLWQLKREQLTLRTQLAAIGYRLGEAAQRELLP